MRQRQLANGLRVAGLNRVGGPPTRETVIRSGSSSSTDPAVPVVLCVWRRVHRLAETLAGLERQQGASIELHVWNNAAREAARVESILRDVGSFAVSVTHSSRNVGGFGRFYLARTLAVRHPFVVFIDDDLGFAPGMVSDLVAEARRESIRGYWCYHLRNPTDYWDRVAATPGEIVDYCSTAGMIADSRVFLEPGLFRCPRRFWFVEDLWLSYFATQVLGWDLVKSNVEFEMGYDGVDQFVYLHRQKSAFLRHLIASGWVLPSGGSSRHAHANPV